MFGIPGLTPVPGQVTIFVLVAALTCSLAINDVVKVALLRRTGAVA